jgi:hypothetical protein
MGAVHRQQTNGRGAEGLRLRAAMELTHALLIKTNEMWMPDYWVPLDYGERRRKRLYGEGEEA